MSAPNVASSLMPLELQEAVLGGRHQVHALDVGVQLPIELVHLELVLEVRDCPQPLHERPSTVFAGKIDEERIKDVDFDVGAVCPWLAG